MICQRVKWICISLVSLKLLYIYIYNTIFIIWSNNIYMKKKLSNSNDIHQIYYCICTKYINVSYYNKNLLSILSFSCLLTGPGTRWCGSELAGGGFIVGARADVTTVGGRTTLEGATSHSPQDDVVAWDPQEVDRILYTWRQARLHTSLPPEWIHLIWSNWEEIVLP